MSDTQETPNETPDSKATPTPENEQGQQTVQDTNGATFTQADVDRIVGERAKRAKDAAINSLLSDLGFESPDDLKAIVTEAKKRKEAEMSEIEKAQLQIEAERKKREEAETKYQEMQQQILQRDRKSAFLQAVQSNGGSQVDDLFILVSAKHGDEFAQVFGDDATPDDKKMDSFIKQVQSSFPTYFGSAGAGSPSNSNGVAPTKVTNDEELKKKLKSKFGKL